MSSPTWARSIAVDAWICHSHVICRASIRRKRTFISRNTSNGRLAREARCRRIAATSTSIGTRCIGGILKLEYSHYWVLLWLFWPLFLLLSEGNERKSSAKRKKRRKANCVLLLFSLHIGSSRNFRFGIRGRERETRSFPSNNTVTLYGVFCNCIPSYSMSKKS